MKISLEKNKLKLQHSFGFSYVFWFLGYRDDLDIEISGKDLVGLLSDPDMELLDERVRKACQDKLEVLGDVDDFDQDMDRRLLYAWYASLILLAIVYCVAIAMVIVSHGLSLLAMPALSELLYTSPIITPIFLTLFGLNLYFDNAIARTRACDAYKAKLLTEALEDNGGKISKSIRKKLTKYVERNKRKLDLNSIIGVDVDCEDMYAIYSDDGLGKQKPLAFVCKDRNGDDYLARHYLIDKEHSDDYIALEIDDNSISRRHISKEDEEANLLKALFEGSKISVVYKDEDFKTSYPDGLRYYSLIKSKHKDGSVKEVGLPGGQTSNRSFKD